jgi:alkylation response protein AidB-like acyl-CoA dehydrogenase
VSAGEVEAAVVEWLREALPPEWIKGIEDGDDELLAEARAEVDYFEFVRRLGESGYATPTWPREYAGLGMSSDDAKIVGAVLARYQAYQSFDFVGKYLAGPTILQWGTDEQKARYLPPLARGEEHWCQLFSEPGSGSDLAGLATRAVRDGDVWIVNGQKVWTSGAHLSHFGLLMARTDPDEPKHRGITYFIADMKAPGVEVRPLRQMSGDAHFNEVFFSDVAIHDDERLGPVNDGWRVSTTTLMNERTSLSGTPTVGGGDVEKLVAHARAVGRWDDLVLRDRLLRLLTEERVLQMTNLRSAVARANGQQPGPEGSITKLYQSGLTQRISRAAVDLLGGRGQAWVDGDDLAVASVQGFLYAPAHTIAGGTSEIQRNIIGERVLGLPKEPDVDKSIPWKEIRRSG